MLAQAEGLGSARRIIGKAPTERSILSSVKRGELFRPLGAFPFWLERSTQAVAALGLG
jgi:hypothetical protein